MYFGGEGQYVLIASKKSIYGTAKRTVREPREGPSEKRTERKHARRFGREVRGAGATIGGGTAANKTDKDRREGVSMSVHVGILARA